jgi:cell wall-associated NlpC family hydrolase
VGRQRPGRLGLLGLTRLWKSVGGAEDMPRVSRDQQAWAVPIPQEQALRGDLVFFGHPVTHVGIVSGGGYMIDAGASKSAVVERRIWTSGVVRYGRVPRPGMPKVTPWTPPPLPSPLPSAPVADSPAAAAAAAPRAVQPAAKPASTTSAQPAAKPNAQPTAKPAAEPAAKPAGLTPLQGLPGVQKAPSSALARKAAANARSAAGRPAGPKGWNDVSLVTAAWRHAGGGVLPSDRKALVAEGKRVALADARVGDLVVYDTPDRPHLGVYLGHGYMVDASATLGRVVVRRVYAAPSVQPRPARVAATLPSYRRRGVAPSPVGRHAGAPSGEPGQPGPTPLRRAGETFGHGRRLPGRRRPRTRPGRDGDERVRVLARPRRGRSSPSSATRASCWP